MSAALEIRCSSLDRYMKCPGFVNFRDLPQSESTEAAEEGTAAGELLQSMLEQRTLTPTVNATAKNGVRFDNDMYFHLKPIAQEILNKNVQVYCEQRVDWKPCEEIDIRGQFDICYLIGRELYIEDLKYGYKIVDVKENWQLLGYAIGTIIHLGSNNITVDRVNFTIHQPRPYHEEGSSRVWSIPATEIMKYYEKICKHMKLVASKKGDCITGSQCRYCPAATEACTAINRATYNAVDVAMSPSNHDSLNEKELAQQLTILQRAFELVKIKLDALNDLAVVKMKDGKVIPGYGLEEKLGDRKWLPDITPEAIKALTGIDATETVMLSPAKIEKMGLSKDFVKSLVTRSYVGFKAVKKDFTKDAEKVFGKK